MQCPSCGFENIPGRQECGVCCSSLKTAPARESVRPPRKRDRPAWARLAWHVRTDIWLGIRWRVLEWARAAGERGPIRDVHWWHLALAIVPGLGHFFVLRDALPAIGMVAVSVLALVFAVWLRGTILGGIGVAVVLALSVFGVFAVVNRHWGANRKGLGGLVWRVAMLMLVLACYQMSYAVIAILINTFLFLREFP